MIRAIQSVKKVAIAELENHIESDYAFVISDLEGFELAGILSKEKTPVFAKAGQIADDDIEVKAGPTDLVPGPAISELGSLGLQVAVEDGKISIKESRVVIKKGEVINENAASIFQKLNIQPFNVGLESLVVYDVEKEKIYGDINIDPEKYSEELSRASGKALGFAHKIVHFCKDTMSHFLAKAHSEFEKVKSFVKELEGKKEDVKEVEVGEDSEDKEVENSEELSEEKNEENVEEVNEGEKKDE